MPLFLRAVALCLCLSLVTCTDAVEPIFDFEAGFLLVEGRITDTPGRNDVRLARSEILFDNYTLVPIAGATVAVIDSDGEEVIWAATNENGVYRAPEDFAAQPGKTYYLRATTPAGEVIESTPEGVPTNVPIADIRVRFQQDAYFSDSRNRFIPAFDLLVDVEDPGDEENFYQYTFTAFEQISICATCMRQVYRNGQCIDGNVPVFVSEYDYLCDVPCWVVNRQAGRNVMSDAFGNGRRIEDVLAGRYDWRRPGGLLLVTQQMTTSRASYEYNSVIEDLAEGGGGLNAPLPAALVGNLSDLSENETPVLGFVGVASVSNQRVYINRESFGGVALPFDSQIRLEPVMPSPPVAPCEGTFRTRAEPDGWEG